MQLTETFLPPDPVPELPHVSLCFDAYKRNDLMEAFAQLPGTILAYGYFTTEEPTTAKLLANSTFKYEKTKRTLYALLFLFFIGFWVECELKKDYILGRRMFTFPYNNSLF